MSTFTMADWSEDQYAQHRFNERLRHYAIWAWGGRGQLAGFSFKCHTTVPMQHGGGVLSNELLGSTEGPYVQEVMKRWDYWDDPPLHPMVYVVEG